ncbi:MAG: NfeD family protein [Cyanobacteriota bacterium SKYGB_h_bin112]|nr:NfeD family protein [Cyanobacteriota bacterium SKYGB_h_bin112]
MNPTLFWVLVGAVLCTLEVFVPTAFAEVALGVSAFLVALISLVLPQFGLQVALWMIVSIVFVILARHFIKPSRRPQQSLDAIEATTLTEILPGKGGRVLYEGNSWQALCEDETMTIASDQPVYVTGRRGTTLLVMPMKVIKDSG